MELKEYIEKHPDVRYYELIWLEAEYVHPDGVDPHFWIKNYILDKEYSVVGSREFMRERSDYSPWELPDTRETGKTRGEEGQMRMTWDSERGVLRVIYYCDRTWMDNDNCARNYSEDNVILADYEYGTWTWSDGVNRDNINSYALEELVERFEGAEFITLSDYFETNPDVECVDIIAVRNFRAIRPLECDGGAFSYLVERQGRYIDIEEHVYRGDTERYYHQVLDRCGKRKTEFASVIQWKPNAKNLIVIRIYHDRATDEIPDVIIDCRTRIAKAPFDDSNRPTYLFDIPEE